ncbi:MAG: transporter substrate-binding domain-containing protein [Desulfobacterales bacterium]|nr:transporter substrate-binding domain-containing protein [Desulfobacterales bacterium]
MTRLNKNIFLSSLMFIFLVSAGYAETKKLRVVYTDWFPYTYQEKGEALGFEIEIFKAVMKSMNIETEFTNYPFQRCVKSLETGTADVLISYMKNPDREKFNDFPDTHISLSKTSLFMKSEKNIPFTGNYQELKGYMIGIVKGFSYGEEFDKADFLKKDNATDTQVLIKMLMNGRYDLIAENQAVINANAMKMGIKDKLKSIEPPIHNKKLYTGFAKVNNLKQVCDDFSKALAEFKKTESYKKILEKYGINPLEMETN